MTFVPAAVKAHCRTLGHVDQRDADMGARADLYVSADIEADGPIPGVYSMLSFGLAVAGSFDGATFTRLDPESATFYRELRPITDRWDPEYLAAAHLDRELLVREGADPAHTMTEAATWVRELAGHRKPVLVAWPLAFDWSFLYWYFERFRAAGSPFGFDSCLDMKTMYQQKAGVVTDLVAKRRMPPSVMPARRHTHHALADALEQAEMFANLFTWRPNARTGPRRRAQPRSE